MTTWVAVCALAIDTDVGDLNSQTAVAAAAAAAAAEKKSNDDCCSSSLVMVAPWLLIMRARGCLSLFTFDEGLPRPTTLLD